MTIRFLCAAGAAVAALAACAPGGDRAERASGEGDADKTIPGESEAIGDAMDACPVLESSDWTAWVSAMPGPDATPTLHVTGKADMPTPGYRFSVEAGMADRSAMPVQRLILTATAPDGMVTQVVTTETVEYSGPAITTTYGGVMIMCGGEALAEITDVMVAQ